MRSFGLLLIASFCSAEILDNGNFGSVEHLQCIGKSRRSPIDIDTHKVARVSLPLLQFNNYDISETVIEKANNYTATIHGYTNWTNQPSISGGPLTGNYKLSEVHWELAGTIMSMINPFEHYGHTVDGARHDMEVDFVHTKDGLSIEESKKIEDGIVVVAVFVNHQRNPFDVFGFGGVSNQSDLFIPDTVGTEFEWVTPDTLLPTELQTYYIYNGTFSHPPCTTNVTWIVLSTAADVLDLQHMRMAYHRKDTQGMLGTRQTLKHSDTVLFNQPTVNLFPGRVAQVTQVPAQSSATVFLIALLAAVIGSACTAFLCCCLNKKISKSSGDYPVQHTNGTDYISLISRDE